MKCDTYHVRKNVFGEVTLYRRIVTSNVLV